MSVHSIGEEEEWKVFCDVLVGTAESFLVVERSYERGNEVYISLEKWER